MKRVRTMRGASKLVRYNIYYGEVIIERLLLRSSALDRYSKTRGCIPK
jgi:hypothetical protein